MPAPKIQSELRAKLKKTGSHLRSAYIKVDVSYTFQQSEILSAFGTETPTDAYTLLNAGLGADIVSKKGNTMFSLSFAANNLLDVAYQSHLSRLKNAPENMANGRTGVFNMGRNFSVRLVVPLIFKKNSLPSARN